MHTISHLIIGIVFALILKLSPSSAIIFILASIITDIDHILELKVINKNFKLEHLFNTKKYKKLSYESPQRTLHIFHTFEIILFLFIISFFYYPIFWVATAFLIHLLFDSIGNIRNRNFGKAGGNDWIKYWFLVYYIKKKSIYNKEIF